ncbi:MAG: peptidoglycan D,D-transpeptidase FtsI family protein [Candidatus Berkiella sp.]
MNNQLFRFRMLIIILCAMGALSAVVYRLWDLQINDRVFLQNQGYKRAVHTVPVIPFRGMILDRHGQPLAISTPVKSIWVDPTAVDLSQKEWADLATLLNRNVGLIKTKIKSKKDKRFLYVKRHLPPNLAYKVSRLKLKGVFLQTEYKRFYPTGEVFAHVLGMTSVDHKGIQGLEQLFNDKLSGKPGRYKVLSDRMGQKVGSLEYEKLPENGENITLSLDSRIQYATYKALKEAVHFHQAKAGTAIVLDVNSGEILAMVNQPSFNPNTKIDIVDSRFRNRAVTDSFEPGSVIKTISMANILESGKFSPETQVDTGPGWMKVSGRMVRDVRNYGVLDLNTIMQKSSNVGMSKLVLSLPPENLLETFRKMGFGQKTDSLFPGEVGGYLNEKVRNHPLSLATMAFGYGLTVTPLQIAQSYAILANHGKKCPISFLKHSHDIQSEQVISPSVAEAINKMLQLSTQKGGTGTKASIPGYQVAGKTGTVRKVSQQGYSDSQHVSVFAGFVPANNPKVAIVVIVDDPSNGKYYGGDVAAPVFSKIAFSTMRILNVPQESYSSKDILVKK